MKIQTYEKLEDLVPKVESELEKTLQERKELGLSTPKKHQVCLTFYNRENSNANASGSAVYINALKVVSDHFKDEEADKIEIISRYFDVTRAFLGDEQWIIQAIYEPEETIKEFEQAFVSEQALQAYKEGFKTRGRTYDAYKKFTINNAETAKKILDEMLPRIKEEFNKASDLALRHEMDHVDFHNSPIYKEFLAKYDHARELQQKLHKGDKSLSKEYAKASMENLKTKTEVDPLAEIRAFFFNHIKPGEWDKANFEEIKNKVFGDFLRYIDYAFPQDILDTLVSQKWSTGEMDTATSMFLFYTVNEQRQSADSKAYVIQPEKVNYALATKILYKEIPEWKMKLAKNAETAVEAIGNAYRDDPSRLKEANNAKTFEEFVEICRGGK